MILRQLCKEYTLLECFQQEGIVHADVSGWNSVVESIALIDEFNCLNLLTLRSPYKVHPSSFSFCWALPGECIGNELVVCGQLFVGRTVGPKVS